MTQNLVIYMKKCCLNIPKKDKNSFVSFNLTQKLISYEDSKNMLADKNIAVK